MRVHNSEKIIAFGEKFPDAKSALEAWLAEANDAIWKTPADVKARYQQASLIHGNRVVFNIRANNYRLIVKINYRYGIIEIRFIGAHAEYDRVNAETI